MSNEKIAKFLHKKGFEVIYGKYRLTAQKEKIEPYYGIYKYLVKCDNKGRCKIHTDFRGAMTGIESGKSTKRFKFGSIDDFKLKFNKEFKDE